MQIICFEDERIEQLRPIIHARPAYAISCASFRLVDWLLRIGGDLCGHVRPHLVELQQHDFPVDDSPETFDSPDGVLLVNARVVPEPDLHQKLLEFASRPIPSAVVDPIDGSLLIARVPRAEIEKLRLDTWEALIASAEGFPPSELSIDAFHWPHEIIDRHMAMMGEAMEWRIAHDGHTQVADGVFMKGEEPLGDQIAIDVSCGPILLDSAVKIGPFTNLSGPIHIGEGTRIAEHASIKDGVALGHTVKVGGEIEASIIEPFTNKQHHGFLGHSYLGSWINLGAGTCNSDLKNTYGKINVEYGPEKVNSDMQFLGCVIGDYSKTAINTSIFTGKVVGVCSMLYGFVTTNVPSFVNYGRTFGQTAQLPADVMITTQQRMFARRGVQQRECDKQLIRDMFLRSGAERETAEFEIL